jgi:glycerol-3-phosphate acyltransferase PlsX
MKVALDAMGTDAAPRVELEGVAMALEAMPELEVVLVGQPQLLGDSTRFGSRLEIVPAPEVVGMHEPPIEVLKRKRNSSMAVSVGLLKQGRVEAVVSAGNTGALMACAVTTLGVVPGVYRPTLAVLFPTVKGAGTIILDVGANVDTKPVQLYQFAVMGATAASFMFHKASPTVGLISNGREETKGNELTLTAHELLKKSELNYIGNVEGNDLMMGTVDVAVCDGFVGNVLLKFGEGLGEVLKEMLAGYLGSKTEYRLRRWFSRPVLSEFLGRMNYEEHGGALMLGVEGAVVAAHGRSTPRAIMNALRAAAQSANDDVSRHIAGRFAAMEQPAP